MNKLTIVLLLSFSCSMLQAQTNIFPSTGAAGIGTVTPNSSSLLDVTSTSKGILIPRMTFTQRNAISAPATGLLIYQMNKTPGFYYFNGGAWTAISSNGVNSTLSNLTSPTAINQSLIPGVSNSIDMGSSTNLWRNAYFSGDALINGLTIGLGTGSITSNSAIGNGTLKTNTTGSFNTAVGQGALNHNDSGSYNTASGSGALYNNNSFANTACGYNALFSTIYGGGNTAVGFQALVSNVAGGANTAIGYEALYGNNGYNNVAIGSWALIDNTSGVENVGVGNNALLYNAGGNDNTASGYYALSHNASGDYSTANGAFALQESTGNSSSAFGYYSLGNNTSGIDNTACGYSGLGTCVTGSNNTSIGYLADIAEDDLNNATAIGSNAVVSLSNCVVLGNSAVTKLGIGVTPSSSNIVQFQTTTAKLTTGGVWTNASDRKLKNNFEKLDSKNILEKVNGLDIERWHYIADKELITHIGPVAQDFYSAFGVGDDTTISTVDPSGIALLAIQALSKENDSLMAANQSLQLQLNGVVSRLGLIEQAMSQCCSSYQSTIDGKSTNASAHLDQNEPNPFIQSTTIHYYIPGTVPNASILISDISGNIVLKYNNLNAGSGALEIKASNLLPGHYQYSLVIDGKVYDSKQMILQK